MDLFVFMLLSVFPLSRNCICLHRSNCNVHHLYATVTVFLWKLQHSKTNFPTSGIWSDLLCSARTSSSLSPLQRAGIHNPLGPRDWILWRKDWVPKSYKECKSIHILLRLHSNATGVSKYTYGQSCVKFINFRGDGNQSDWFGKSLDFSSLTKRCHDIVVRQEREISPPPF